MSQKPEHPGTPDPHKDMVDALFSAITPWYDFQNHFFSLGLDFWWRRNLVRNVVPGPTGLVLDLAAGTLDVSLALCRHYPHLQMKAVDICEPMLEYGRKRKMRKGEEQRVEIVVADARSLPFEDRCADAVTMAFGIRNVMPRAEALREMHRVLVPGGRACILEFAPVSTPFFGPLYHWYLKNIMPTVAGWFSGEKKAYKYLAASVESFPAPEEFSRELLQAGFPFVQYQSFTLGVANLHVAIKGGS